MSRREYEPVRKYAIKITVDQDAERILNTAVLIELLFSLSHSIPTIEFLSYPDHDGQQVYVIAFADPKTPEPIAPDSVAGPAPSDLIQTPNVRSGPSQAAYDRLQELLSDIEGLDISRGHLYLGPVASDDATTIRGLVRHNDVLVGGDLYVDNRFADLLEQLRNEPHIYQLLITKQSGNRGRKYKLSMRLALFADEHQLEDDIERKRHIRGNDLIPDPLSEAYGDFDIVTNLSLIDKFYVSVTVPQTSDSKIKQTDKKSQILDLTLGEGELDPLLKQKDTGRLYEKIGYHPRMPTAEDLYTHIFQLINVNHQTPWTKTAGSAPVFVEIEEDSNGSNIDPAAADPATAHDRVHDAHTETTANEGTEYHQRLVDETRRKLERIGYRVYVPEQDSRSIPDLLAFDTDTDEVLAVEIANTSTSNPGKLLTNIARARNWGLKVLIVTGALADSDDNHHESSPHGRRPIDETSSTKKAEKIIDLVDQPFRNGADLNNDVDIPADATVLYKWKVRQFRDGTWPVLPKDTTTGRTAESATGTPGEPEYCYTYDPDGTVTLVVDGEPRGSVHAEDPIRDAEFDVPHLEKEENGPYAVYDRDGEKVATYRSKTEAKEDWKFLQVPHVPQDLTYISDIDEVWYHVGADAFNIKPTIIGDDADAIADDDDDSVDYVRVFKELDKFLIEHDGARVQEDEIYKFADEWVRERTPKDEFSKNKYGEYRTHIGLERVTDSKPHYYEDKLPRLLRDITPPDHPGSDSSPPLPDEWTPNDT